MRTLHVEHCMGTVFTIDIRGGGEWTRAVAEAVAELHRVDALFSTYRSDSDVSRMHRGELTAEAADPDVAAVLDLCAQLSTETGGYFSARSASGIDPTGVVKGWAIERVSELLRGHGSTDHAVNGGGDMQLVGGGAPDRPWRVGISDPYDATRLLTTVCGRDVAVATSGIAERGQHIVDPFTGRPPEGVAAVTVVGSSLTRVDAYATAAFAMGSGAIGWLERLPGHEGLVVDTDGRLVRTSGFGRYEPSA